MNLNTFFSSKGYDITERNNMLPYIELWDNWYKGDVPDFQNYFVYNGEKKICKKRRTLNMGKKISEDFANILLNEKVTYKIGNEEQTKQFCEILDKNDFYVKGTEYVEKSFALGLGAIVITLGNMEYDEETEIINTTSAEMVLEFATAGKIIPLSYTNNKIKECAFAISKVINNKPVMLIAMHTLDDNGNYVIDNYAFKVSKNGALTDITDKMTDTLKHFETNSPYPWFSIIRPNITNNIYKDSPFGVSVYANSIDVFKGLDIAYDSLLNEFELGRKRIFVKSNLLKPDITTGEMRLVFDTNDVVFHALPTDDDGKGDIHEVDLQLRIEEHEKAIQLMLNLLSSKLGFGEKRYNFQGGSLTTATQVISENSEEFRTIKKHELSLENSLYDLFKSMMYIANTFLGYNFDMEAEISIGFDDSIIEDTSEIKRQALLELNAGLIDNIEYYIKVYKMTEEQAVQYAETIKNRRMEELKEEPEDEDEGGENGEQQNQNKEKVKENKEKNKEQNKKEDKKQVVK